jgi:asparagine synthase (glutamine-hydrolysing)
MCGIVGFVSARGAPPPRRDRIEAAVGALTHRGPDGCNSYHGDCASLGHTRLSIIDVPGGFQPMTNEDRSVWTIYNGEIWNYRQLRDRLAAAGHVFVSNCDTEVVVHAYEEWGDDLVRHLDGMFAFAVWDERGERLLLARDRLGKKPLYVRVSSDGLAFGSDARSVLLAGGEQPAISTEHLPQFLFQRYVNAPFTLFDGVEKLLPATILTYDRDTVASVSYWGLEPAPGEADVRPERLRDLLRAAVEKRLMSDVPLGVFLSGGVDSALVLGLTRELAGDGVPAFTIGYDDPVFDERPAAKLSADRHRADWHALSVSPGEFVDALPRLSWYRDEPIAEPSEIPLLLLSEFAARHVTVVLSGEGSDELFGGYPKYRAERLLGLGAPVAAALRAVALARARRPSHRAFDRAAETMAIQDQLLRWASWFRSFGVDEVRDLLAPGAAPSDEELTAPLERRLADYAPLDRGRRMLVGDLLTYLPDNLLLRGDKVTMAASLEARMPLLDRAIVETAHRMPLGRRAGLRRSKSLLRAAVADLVPAAILGRAKRGFPVPVGRLITNHALTERVLLSDRSLDRGLLSADAVRRLVAATPASAPGHDLKLFTLLSLELWLRANVDAVKTSPPESLEQLVELDREPVGAA